MGEYLGKFDSIVKYISKEVREILLKINIEKSKHLEEIRLRANKPIILHNYREDWFVNYEGGLQKHLNNVFIVKQEEILKTLEIMSRNSIYAFQNEIKNGFLTLPGGHRIGIAGKAVIQGNQVVNIRDITSLNIRISREIKGCSLGIIKSIINIGNKEVYNTLIVSPPQCGKTTMLRDIARLLSNGMKEIDLKGIKVGIVDERSEIAACYKGLPQFDIGVRTDVLDGCPKSIGMRMMIRSMSPQVIITDEIGDRGDRDSIISILNAGIKIITTAHGFNISELKSRREVLDLIEEKVFERYIVLGCAEGPGTIDEIIDGCNMTGIYKRNSRGG